MSIIIRLQNLPWAANAADIRQYFQGLSIPEGGVHIVGGEKGDAFISFSTDEDARQAMLSDGGCIKEVQIRLLLSSRNEMQKVIENARQQSMQFSQVYIQQQPQLPIVGSLPPLTAKVLPQPQQQQVRPDRIVPIMRRHQPIMDPSATLLMSHNAQQQQTLLHQQQQLLLQQQLQQHLQPQQQQQQQHLSPKMLENKDRDDKNHKRERTRSKSRDRRSKSTRSVGGGSNSSNRRDRSRSRDRRRRDRSRGRDRSRSKERHRTGGGRNSSSHGNGGKSSYRSRSPVAKSATGEQQNQIKPWPSQYGNMLQPGSADTHQQLPATNAGPGAPMFTQFRTPPQPPIIAIHPQNSYQQQPIPSKNEWTMVVGDERQQQQYIPNNNFGAADDYDDGSGGSDDDDEDDLHDEYENSTSYQGRFNDNNNAIRMRGPQEQDFHDQQGFVPNRGPRFNKPVRGGGHRPYDEFGRGGRGGGPRFNYQPPPRYNGGNNNNNNGVDGGGRPSRFNSSQDGSGARPGRFNAPSQQSGGNGASPGFEDSAKRMPQRYNDRYRYDVRNAPQVPKSGGLCVEVNNMSSHFSYGDVRKLFEGIHIDGSGIKIQKHRQGVAFVRFDNNHNKNLAMKVDGTEYKGSNIVVKHLDDEAYERDNTDDRPYPSAGTVASTPTIVDHVDLVDDDDDEEEEDNKKKGGSKKQADDKDKQPRDNKDKKSNNSTADDDDDDNSDCNLVVCEKNNVKDTVAVAKDGDEESSRQDESIPTRFRRLEQIPNSVTMEDVFNEIGCNDVRHVIIFPDGELKGAAIEFHTVEAALRCNDCVLLCSTPVPVIPCSYKDYTEFKELSKRIVKPNNSGGGRHYHHNNHHQQNHNHQQQPVAPLIPSLTSQLPIPPPTPPNLQSMSTHVRSNCVYIYGLPTTVTNTDITQFFADTSVLPDKIHIMLNKFGHPTGESYCEFSTAQQAHVALSKDHCWMGPEQVCVEPIGRSEMIQAITKPMQQRNQNREMEPWSGGGGMRGGMGGGPRPPPHNNNNPHHHQQQGGPQSFNGGPYGGRPPQQQYNNNNNGGGRGGYTPRMRGPNTGPDGFGQPGCVVAMDNVPYRADVQEIVNFFEGFELNSQNVIRRFNDFGKPTGEARVNLRSPQDAMRAFRTLQNKPIFNRPVHLTLL